LSSCIQNRRFPNQSSNKSEHLDSAAYWKAEYEESKDAQLHLQARIAQLENELSILKHNETSTAPTSISKRKRDARDATESFNNRSQKKPRTRTKASALGSQGTFLDGELWSLKEPTSTIAGELPSSIASIHTNKQGNDVPHHFYLLQQTLAQSTIDPLQLAATLCHIANAMCLVITGAQCSEDTQNATIDLTQSNALIPRESMLSQDPSSSARSAEGKSTAIASIFPELLHGLNKLGKLEGGISIGKRVIYCYIKIFQCLLEHICHLSKTCTNQSTAQVQDIPPTARTPKKIAKCSRCRERSLKCDQRKLSCQNCKHNNLTCDRSIPSTTEPSKHPPQLPEKSVLMLCELTISMLRSLDTSKTAHQEILEGYLFLLFDKIGKGLKHAVFGSDEEANIPSGTFDRNMENAFSTQENDNREDDTVIEAQAPYLIWILSRTQAFISPQHHHNPPDTTHPSPNVAAIARTKLQYTLLKAVFGDRAPPEYEPALTAPHVPTDAELQEILAIPKVEVKDWYKHEVWRLFGWDVLRSHRWRDA